MPCLTTGAGKGYIINEDRELEQKGDSINGTSSRQEGTLETSGVIQMRSDVFFPDVKETHLHNHDVGCPFTGVDTIIETFATTAETASMQSKK